MQIIANVVRRPDSTYPAIVKPYKLDMSQFGEKVRDEIRFTITNVSEQDLIPTLVSTRPEYFSVDLPSKIKAGQSGEAVLKLTDQAVKEAFEKSFTFEVNDETQSRFTVPVKRVIRNTAAPITTTKSPGK